MLYEPFFTLAELLTLSYSGFSLVIALTTKGSARQTRLFLTPSRSCFLHCVPKRWAQGEHSLSMCTRQYAARTSIGEWDLEWNRGRCLPVSPFLSQQQTPSSSFTCEGLESHLSVITGSSVGRSRILFPIFLFLPQFILNIYKDCIELAGNIWRMTGNIPCFTKCSVFNQNQWVGDGWRK